MPDQKDTKQSKGRIAGFAGFAFKRIVIAAAVILLVVWGFSQIPSMLRPSGDPPKVKKTAQQPSPNEMPEDFSQTGDQGAQQTHPQHAGAADGGISADRQHPGGPQTSAGLHSEAKSNGNSESSIAAVKQAPAASQENAAPGGVTAKDEHGDDLQPEARGAQAGGKKETPAADDQAHSAAVPEPHAATPAPEHAKVPTGVVFVEAVIQPMEFELHDRWWGWRPNDLVNVTDNVNNMQLGILEVTRRSAIQLSERISRTGTTDAFNRHLENAVNWLMVKPDRYWFPSPESKYKESLDELKAYVEQLKKGQASFYTRSDNLIPLLASYAELLGSCDENLVKQKNEDGSAVGLFQADDYFYYAKGVAGAMATILESVHHDFVPTIESRHGIELLHHAILSCQQAAKLSPLLITNGSLDGILANHRANIAAPISHARFFIGQLIKTLST